MNWTEGYLARHSRGKSAKDDALRRQKQYFARARTRLLNGGDDPSPGVLPFAEARHDRSSGHGNPFGREDAPLAAKRRRDEDPIYRIWGRAAGTPFGNEGERLHSTMQAPAQAQAPAEGLRGELVSQRKRRRLLRQSDWAGLSMQQPLDLKFSGVRQPGHLWGKQDGPRRPSQARARHAYATDQRYPGITAGGKHGGPLSPRIRVQIGSQQMSRGTESVSRRSKERGYSSSESSGSRTNRIGSVRRLGQPSSSSAEGCHVHSELGAGRVPPVASISRNSLSCDEHRKPSKRYSREHCVRLQQKIHEPVPLRAGHFPVLQWSPLRAQDSQSLLVETGRRPAKPPSQVADEGKWFKLTEPPSEELIALTRGSSLLGSPSFCLTNSMRVFGEKHCSSSIVSNSSQRSIASSARDGPMDSSDANGLADSVENEAGAGTSPGSYRIVQSPEVTVSQPRHVIATESPNKGSEGQAPSGENDEGEDQVWKEFIDGNEGDESRRRELIEAARSAARRFEPCDSSPTSSSRLCSELLQMMTEKMETRVCALGSDPESLDNPGNSDGPGHGDGMPIDLSSVASYGSEPSEPSGLVKPYITLALPQSEMGVFPVPPDGLNSLKHPESPSMVVSSDPDSTMAIKASSSEDVGPEEIRRPFQFAIPRSFVGKLAETDKVVSVQPPQHKPGRGRGKGRRRRKAEDGRTNIRSLPDFEEDPIEDTDRD